MNSWNRNRLNRSFLTSQKTWWRLGLRAWSNKWKIIIRGPLLIWLMSHRVLMIIIYYLRGQNLGWLIWWSIRLELMMRFLFKSDWINSWIRNSKFISRVMNLCKFRWELGNRNYLKIKENKWLIWLGKNLKLKKIK